MPVQFTIYDAPVGLTSIALTVFASIGGFVFGYDTGQIACITPLPDFLQRFGQTDASGKKYLSNARNGLIVGLLSIGTLTGAVTGGYISDIIGRRKAMTCAASMIVVGIIIQMTSTHVWQQFAMGRFVAGLGVGALSANVPTYQAELAPKQIRGSLVGTYQLAITLGILVAECFGIGLRRLDSAASWRTLIGLCIVFCFILGVGILFMPESPRWLLMHGKPEEARKSLARVRGTTVDALDPYVEHDFHEIQKSCEIELTYGKGTWSECFSSRMRKRTLLGILLQMFQQLTGANFFFYYGATLFAGVGLSDGYATQIILGAVNVVCTFPGLYFYERFGRRKPLIFGGIWQSFWLFAYSIAGTAGDPLTSKPIGNFMIVASCLFIAGFASCWGPGVWLVTSEMYPTRTRAKMQSLSVSSNWLWNFLLAFFTPFITDSISYRYGFVFACCNFVGMAIVFFFIKEGAGLSLEQLEVLWEDKDTPAWRSASWSPPGYANRRDAMEVNSNEKKGLATQSEPEHHEDV